MSESPILAGTVARPYDDCWDLILSINKHSTTPEWQRAMPMAHSYARRSVGKVLGGNSWQVQGKGSDKGQREESPYPIIALRMFTSR
jgi:hypothetical protein